MYDSIFLDCDGVVTDTRARVDGRVMFEAYRLAHSGKRIAFVTGRSLDWLTRNIIPAISRMSPTPDEKARLFFVGECGNRWLSFSGGGLAHGEDDSHAIPASVRSGVRQEMSRFPYLFFDETKESFISLEIRHERLTSPQAEKEAHMQLSEAKGFLSSTYPAFSITQTLYAVDLMGKGVGKASAARRALELMGSTSSALIIGDSEIDFEMGDELARSGIKFDFYYVGAEQPPRTAFQVKKAPAPYSEGALEVLRNVR